MNLKGMYVGWKKHTLMFVGEMSFDDYTYDVDVELEEELFQTVLAMKTDNVVASVVVVDSYLAAQPFWVESHLVRSAFGYLLVELSKDSDFTNQNAVYATSAPVSQSTIEGKHQFQPSGHVRWMLGLLKVAKQLKNQWSPDASISYEKQPLRGMCVTHSYPHANVSNPGCGHWLCCTETASSWEGKRCPCCGAEIKDLKWWRPIPWTPEQAYPPDAPDVPDCYTNADDLLEEFIVAELMGEFQYQNGTEYKRLPHLKPYCVDYGSAEASEYNDEKSLVEYATELLLRAKVVTVLQLQFGLRTCVIFGWIPLVKNRPVLVICPPYKLNENVRIYSFKDTRHAVTFAYRGIRKENSFTDDGLCHLFVIYREHVIDTTESQIVVARKAAVSTAVYGGHTWIGVEVKIQPFPDTNNAIQWRAWRKTAFKALAANLQPQLTSIVTAVSAVIFNAYYSDAVLFNVQDSVPYFWYYESYQRCWTSFGRLDDWVSFAADVHIEDAEDFNGTDQLQDLCEFTVERISVVIPDEKALTKKELQEVLSKQEWDDSDVQPLVKKSWDKLLLCAETNEERKLQRTLIPIMNDAIFEQKYYVHSSPDTSGQVQYETIDLRKIGLVEVEFHQEISRRDELDELDAKAKFNISVSKLNAIDALIQIPDSVLLCVAFKHASKLSRDERRLRQSSNFPAYQESYLEKRQKSSLIFAKNVTFIRHSAMECFGTISLPVQRDCIVLPLPDTWQSDAVEAAIQRAILFINSSGVRAVVVSPFGSLDYGNPKDHSPIVALLFSNVFKKEAMAAKVDFEFAVGEQYDAFQKVLKPTVKKKAVVKSKKTVEKKEETALFQRIGDRIRKGTNMMLKKMQTHVSRNTPISSVNKAKKNLSALLRRLTELRVSIEPGKFSFEVYSYSVLTFYEKQIWLMKNNEIRKLGILVFTTKVTTTWDSWSRKQANERSRATDMFVAASTRHSLCTTHLNRKPRIPH
jgi:hypothetical protein